MSPARPALAALALAALALATAAPARAALPPRFALERAPGPPAVCVLYFDNHTGDPRYDPLKKGLADMMLTDLAAVPGLAVVERSRLEDVVTELALQRSSLFDAATAQRVGQLVGAKFAVTGAITAVAPKVRLDVRLVEVATGRVVVADKVVGAPDDLFGLQSALAALFVASLGRTVAAPPRPPKSLEHLRRFGEALDLADRGDDQAASRQLGALVAEDPGFGLAKTRYGELLQRLYAAQEKRSAGLAGAEAALLAKADAELEGEISRAFSKKALSRHLGYRVLRGHLFLALIARATGSANPFIPVEIPAAQRDAVQRWMVAFWDNQRALADALALVRDRIPPFPDVDDADIRSAQELGLGTSPHRLPFMSPQTVLRGLASFAVLGKVDIVASVHVAVKPSLARLDPAYGERALPLLDAALADIAAHERTHAQRETLRALDLYGEVLLALGRPIEAVARWQRALDDYPTAPEFEALEAKVKAALARLP